MSACCGGNGIGGGKPCVAFEVAPRIGEQRFVLRLLRDGLIVLRLIDRRIDLREYFAALDVLAFAEIQLDQFAVDLRSDGDGVERANGADAIEIDRHRGGACGVASVGTG